jgi:hypothetical protein
MTHGLPICYTHTLPLPPAAARCLLPESETETERPIVVGGMAWQLNSHETRSRSVVALSQTAREHWTKLQLPCLYQQCFAFINQFL